jgi:hypothetical protein
MTATEKIKDAINSLQALREDTGSKHAALLDSAIDDLDDALGIIQGLRCDATAAIDKL